MLETMLARTGRITRQRYIACQALALLVCGSAYGAVLGAFYGLVLLIGPKALNHGPTALAIAGVTILMILAVVLVWAYVGFNLVKGRLRDIGLPNWYYVASIAVAVVAQLKYLDDPIASAIGRSALVIEIVLSLLIALAPTDAVLLWKRAAAGRFTSFERRRGKPLTN